MMTAMSLDPTSSTARAMPSGPWLYAGMASGHESSWSWTREGNGAAAAVDQVVDAHEEAARLRHELPDPRGADLRVRAQIEARLDERQPRELGRQTLFAEDALHLREIAPRRPDPVAEPLAEPALAVE